MSAAPVRRPALRLRCISSMATRRLLVRLAGDYRDATGIDVALESVAGVDAARRLAAGESFDLAVLAADAVSPLAADGHLVAGTEVAVALSGMAAALAPGRRVPVVDTLPALLELLAGAAAVGYSTGPSGRALLDRLERWGVLEALRPRLRQAPPGRPVAGMVARGEVEIGFQQLSEMIGFPGVTVLADLPAEAEILTAFVAAVGVSSRRPEAARAFAAYLGSQATAAAKRAEGMRPVPGAVLRL